MDQTQWQRVAQEAIDYLVPYASAILLGLESAKRQLGRHIERKEFVNAKSVYAVLKSSFERDVDAHGRSLLDAFVREPDSYRIPLIELVSSRATAAPDDLGRKLLAIAHRLRDRQQSTP